MNTHIRTTVVDITKDSLMPRSAARRSA
jgi:hypothetical protein